LRLCIIYLFIDKFADKFIASIPVWCYYYPISKKKEEKPMTSVMSAINNTVPISQFNKGLAGKIFEDVKRLGAKVVMKNNVAECVLLSPDEYAKLMEEVNDARLITLASERLKSYDPEGLISHETMMESLGITQKMIDSVGEVDIE
jgi:PHD/YefM family antitoxin component YafN of YafNO toxin-antitoxin module